MPEIRRRVAIEEERRKRVFLASVSELEKFDLPVRGNSN
jgi:hypothetical protein